MLTGSLKLIIAGKMLVYPNEFSLPLMPNFGLPPPPMGMLHVKVRGCWLGCRGCWGPAVLGLAAGVWGGERGCAPCRHAGEPDDGALAQSCMQVPSSCLLLRVCAGSAGSVRAACLAYQLLYCLTAHGLTAWFDRHLSPFFKPQVIGATGLKSSLFDRMDPFVLLRVRDGRHVQVRGCCAPPPAYLSVGSLLLLVCSSAWSRPAAPLPRRSASPAADETWCAPQQQPTTKQHVSHWCPTLLAAHCCRFPIPPSADQHPDQHGQPPVERVL